MEPIGTSNVKSFSWKPHSLWARYATFSAWIAFVIHGCELVNEESSGSISVSPISKILCTPRSFRKCLHIYLWFHIFPHFKWSIRLELVLKCWISDRKFDLHPLGPAQYIGEIANCIQRRFIWIVVFDKIDKLELWNHFTLIMRQGYNLQSEVSEVK